MRQKFVISVLFGNVNAPSVRKIVRGVEFVKLQSGKDLKISDLYDAMK